MAVSMEGQPMSCRGEADKWRHDRERQSELAKKTAKLTGQTQVLYRKADGSFAFAPEGSDINGEQVEIITIY
jgi:hypothetical protein